MPAVRLCGDAYFPLLPPSRYPCGQDAGAANQGGKRGPQRRAIAVARALEQAYLSAQIGTTQEVLWEEPAGEGLYTGHTPTYTKVYAPGNGLHNQICNVTITGLYKDGLLGQL